MRIPALLALMTVLLTSCHESERAISVTETRELTLFDLKYQANIKDLPPLEWRRIPGTENRALNYVTGPDDSVEIFMGVFGGGVLPNANRWLGQFGLDPATGLDSFTKIEILGKDGYIVEASGDLEASMGNEGAKDQGLLGFVRQSGEETITLKMVGSAIDVAAQKEAFLAYVSSLEFIDTHILETP
ncbi:MAG: hypothetical protein ABF377_13290 [Akkermansiaceae bacterium]